MKTGCAIRTDGLCRNHMFPNPFLMIAAATEIRMGRSCIPITHGHSSFASHSRVKQQPMISRLEAMLATNTDCLASPSDLSSENASFSLQPKLAATAFAHQEASCRCDARACMSSPCVDRGTSAAQMELFGDFAAAHSCRCASGPSLPLACRDCGCALNFVGNRMRSGSDYAR